MALTTQRAGRVEERGVRPGHPERVAHGRRQASARAFLRPAGPAPFPSARSSHLQALLPRPAARRRPPRPGRGSEPLASPAAPHARPVLFPSPCCGGDSAPSGPDGASARADPRGAPQPARAAPPRSRCAGGHVAGGRGATWRLRRLRMTRRSLW